MGYALEKSILPAKLLGDGLKLEIVEQIAGMVDGIRPACVYNHVLGDDGSVPTTDYSNFLQFNVTNIIKIFRVKAQLIVSCKRFR